jgi:hypothetical protein
MQEQPFAEPTPYAQPQEPQANPHASPSFAGQARNAGFANGQTQLFLQIGDNVNFPQHIPQNPAQNIPPGPYPPVSQSRPLSIDANQSESPTLANASEQGAPEAEPQRKQAKGKGKRPANEAEEEVDGGRAAQAARNSHEPIPLSPPSHDAPKLILQSGPMSKSHVLLGKPKPGRKPVQSKPGDDRRREQNRTAQRKFRHKTSEKVRVMEDELRLRQQQIREVERDRRLIAAEKRAYDQQVRQLRMENEQLKAAQTSQRNGRNDSTIPTPTDGSIPALPTRPRQPQTHGPYAKFVAPPTPPEPNAYETDFTNFGRTVPLATSSSSDLGPSGLVDDPCGFCTDAQNCACKQDSGPEPEPQGPGNCAACIADPQRAQACRQLAASSTLYPNFRPLHSEQNGNMFNTRGAQPLVRSDSHSGRMSCEQLMDCAESSGQRLASIAELFGDQIHAHPTANGRFEVDKHEAAQALQSLSTRHIDFNKAGKS